MNDKDKEAFDKWWEEKGFYKGEGYAIFKIFRDSKEVWEDACEYKQKEIDELKSTLIYIYDWYGMFMGDVAKDKIKKAVEGKNE